MAGQNKKEKKNQKTIYTVNNIVFKQRENKVERKVKL